MHYPQTIYLASRSPRRAELLQQIGVKCTVIPADIDESPLRNEAPSDYVQRLARAKALKCVEDLQLKKWPMLPILAADTTVTIDGLILGKPETDDEAYTMLQRMSGRHHEVHTGVAVAHQDWVEVALSTTRVHLAALTQQQIEAYIQTGEPKDKAGAYGIQGLASTFIRHIEGSYSGVMGLPVFETSQLLARVGIHVL